MRNSRKDEVSTGLRCREFQVENKDMHVRFITVKLQNFNNLKKKKDENKVKRLFTYKGIAD